MCFDVSEVVLSGRARALLQLIRERSPSKSGLGRPQYSKENEHESSLERGEFLCCSSNFGVPRNHWSEHWSRLKEVTPRCYGFDRVPPARQPTTQQTAAAKKITLWLSLCSAMKRHGQTLLSGSSVCSSVPAPSRLYSAPNLLALLPVSCCRSHTCTLDRFGHWILGASS